VVVPIVALPLLCCGGLTVVRLLRSDAPNPPQRAHGAGMAVVVEKVPARKNLPRPMPSTGWTTIRGRVRLEGDRPDIEGLNKAMLAAIDANRDRNHCLEGAAEDKWHQQTWRIGKDNGVGNVFVWLAPPNGQYFKVDLTKKTWPKEVVIDQPQCAFVPHAAVLFPGAYDPENPDELKPSGQMFIVRNSAPMNHTTQWQGGDANPGDNKIIPSKNVLVIDLKPEADPVILKCNIHPFMRGVLRVFDHPYAAVTDKDGNYNIEHVPADAELRIVVWHEKAGYGNKGEIGDKVTLEAGKDNVHDYTIKAR
jgi:hypothetical protein